MQIQIDECRAAAISDFIQRLTWPGIRAHSASDEEAYLVREAFEAMGRSLVLGSIASRRFRDAGNNFASRNFADYCSFGRRLKEYCSSPNGSVRGGPARCGLRSRGQLRSGMSRDHSAKPGATRTVLKGLPPGSGYLAAMPVHWAQGPETNSAKPGNKFLQTDAPGKYPMGRNCLPDNRHYQGGQQARPFGK